MTAPWGDYRAALSDSPHPTRPRLLVAGIGNIFLGDDAFGIEVANQLLQRTLPEEVCVVDYGIRGFDLAYALMDEYDLAILVDAMPQGGPAGTLYVLEPQVSQFCPETMLEAAGGHGLNPQNVFRLVQSMGGRLPPLRVVGCEPATLGTDEDPVMGLSPPVQAAIPEAIRLIESLIAETLSISHKGGSS